MAVLLIKLKIASESTTTFAVKTQLLLDIMSLNYRLFTFLVLFLSSFSILPAQFTVEGKVVNGEDQANIQFATVSLISAADSSVVVGTVTNAEGAFNLKSAEGSYILKTTSIGYEPYFSEIIRLNKENPILVLSLIRLTPTATLLEEVDIEAQKSSMELALDKRVFNVGQDLANSGANASEILSNIPSVTVDPEGNVKLRGSSDVRILIDGKPSGLVNVKGGKGLQQLQGSLIESIEVITNPSARYEAEGNAGVINIVLKKDRKEGFNGSFEATVGHPTNFGGAANLNYRYKKINFFINYGINYRVQPNIASVYQEVYAGDTTFIQKQERVGDLTGFNNNIRGGLDYFFNERNILTASYRFQRSDGRRLTEISYEDYLNSVSNLTATTIRNQDEIESEPYSEYALTYKKMFLRKNHELNVDLRYLNYWENSDQKFTEVTFLPGETRDEGVVSKQNSINDEYEDQYLIQIDYVQPIGKEGKFETGLRSSFRDMTNDYLATELNDLDEWIPIPEFDNIFDYQEDIHAVYGIIGNKGKKLSYQVGLRGEATEVKTTLRKTNEENPRSYQNLFPSAHLAYHLPGSNDVQISYSRRVRRPTYRELSPFITLADGRNFFSGNPDLNPEFAHALEIGHLKYFEKGSLSSALYYRNSTGTIQDIRIISADGTSSRKPENLNNQHAFGAEFAFGYNLYKWWKLDASFNFFRAITDGTNIDASFSSDTYSWFVRQTSKFNLAKQLSIQFRGNYEAPELTPQGRRKALYWFDLAIQKDIWNSKGRITLNAMDVLNSRIMRNTFEGETFFSDVSGQFRRRQINLTLTYRINQ